MLQRQSRAPRQCPDFPRSHSSGHNVTGECMSNVYTEQSVVSSITAVREPGSEAQLWKLDEQKCLHLSFLIIERCLCLWRSAVTRGWSRDWGLREQRKRREQRTVLTREPGVSHRTRGERGAQTLVLEISKLYGIYTKFGLWTEQNANKDFFDFSE